MGATDALREDHRQIRRLQAVISRCHVALSAGSDIPLDDMDRIPRIIGGFVDSVHYSREEDSYFPCVAGYGGLNEDIRRLLIEHEFSRRIAANIEGHLAAWRAGRDSREPVARYMRTYCIYLEDHMGKEERFFDRAEAESLSPEEERQMYEQFRTSVADSRMGEMVRELEYLEGREWCKGEYSPRNKNTLPPSPAVKPFVLWMTGLPCSGKSTIVRRLQKDIPNLAMLDGDELREWFSPKDFSKAGRDEHNIRVAHLAKLLLHHGVPSVVSLVSPYRENRSSAREIIDAGESFAECYVRCSLAKCEERDVKGMYARARRGEIKGFTGIDDPYEAPERPDLLVDTESETLEASSDQVMDFLRSRGLV